MNNSYKKKIFPCQSVWLMPINLVSRLQYKCQRKIELKLGTRYRIESIDTVLMSNIERKVSYS